MNLRLLTAAMTAVLLLSACAGETEAENTPAETEIPAAVVSAPEEKQEESPLILACGRDFVKTHPAKRKGVDSSLTPLLYESLVSVDHSYHWKGELAESIQQDGLSYTITLKEASFSDGSSLRASDVAASLATAMEEGSLWKERLSILEDCTVLSGDQLRITVTQQRQDFVNLLTFPITKQSGELFLGSGPYCLSEESGNMELVQNPHYNGENNGENAGLESIVLNKLPNQDTLKDSLRIGKINCLFDDLSDGEAMNLSEDSQTVEIGHLLFLGVNGNRGMTQQAEVRRAISCAINRQVLVDRVYASKAAATTTPFHPAYYQIAGHQDEEMSADEIHKLLEAAGLVKNAQGFYATEEQSDFILLYNSENPYRPQTAELLRQQLAGIGLEIRLSGLPYQEYMTALEKGEYDLYLGELAIDESMDIRKLLYRGADYGFGISDNSVSTVYEAFQQGSASAELFLSVYQQNMPAIPLLYCQGLIVYGSGVQVRFSPSPGQAFSGISSVK